MEFAIAVGEGRLMHPFYRTALFVIAATVVLSSARSALASVTDGGAAGGIDPAPCFAAAAANDSDGVIASCGALIDSDKTPKADRVKALVARGGAYHRRGEFNRAIADYDAVLELDPSLADIFNARGVLWRAKGDLPRASRDFEAALRLKPDDVSARANHKSLALELERIGAQMAVKGKPSFDCAKARRAVEKAICVDPELADLDREVDGAVTLAMRDAAEVGKRAVRTLRREQAEFIARRNTSFGRPGYDLKKAMRERIQQLLGVDGY